MGTLAVMRGQNNDPWISNTSDPVFHHCCQVRFVGVRCAGEPGRPGRTCHTVPRPCELGPYLRNWTPGPLDSTSSSSSPSRRAEFVSTSDSYKARPAPKAAKQIGCEASPERSLPTEFLRHCAAGALCTRRSCTPHFKAFGKFFS